MRVHRCQQPEIPDARATPEEVRKGRKVGVKRIKKLQIERLHHLPSPLVDAEKAGGMPHAVHHRTGLFLPGSGNPLRVKEMKVEEGEVRIRKIPSIVHRWAKQAIRTNHVKQTA